MRLPFPNFCKLFILKLFLHELTTDPVHEWLVLKCFTAAGSYPYVPLIEYSTLTRSPRLTHFSFYALFRVYRFMVFYQLMQPNALHNYFKVQDIEVQRKFLIVVLFYAMFEKQYKIWYTLKK